MPDHIGSIAAVEFGRTTIDEEYDDGTVKLEHHEDPGTYTLTVTGLPEDIEWSNGMTVAISRAPHPHAPERISYSNGTDQLDEIYLRNVDVHIEQMDSNYYWMCFRRGTDRLTVNLGAKRALVNGTVDENDLGIKEDR